MTEENPWKTLKSRVVYKNAWITVREHDVVRPDGNDGIYGVVETRVATGVVALTDKHEVYLVGQYRFPTEVYSWEIIEGGAEEGEPALAAAKRELKEEAGLEAEQWQQLGHELHLSNCHSDEVAIIYLAQGLKEVPAAPEGTEILQIKKMPFAEAYELVTTGKIYDAMSVVAIYELKRLIDSGTISGR